MSGEKHGKKFQEVYLDTPFFLPCLHLGKDMGSHVCSHGL